ncbi:MAG TPA: PEGA domain-containing protein, partial [Polyangiaceae bacterium]|nr:PEGA domain-containing protein [Polyangiaceae bacterium]
MRQHKFRNYFAAFLVLASTAGPALGQPAPSAETGTEGDSRAAVRPLAETLTEQALAEYEAGKLLFGDGDFAGASVKFQRAYEISKDGRLLWNKAVCEKNLRHYAAVLRLVRRYQQEAGPMLSEADQQEAADLIHAVSNFVSPVWVTIDETGATISVDGEVIGTSPLTEPFLVDMGSRQITVSKPGFRDYTQTVQVAGMSELRLSIRMDRESVEGRLLIAAGPGETIFLDGKVVAEGRWDGNVSPGRHNIRVTAPGKEPYDSDVEVRAKETRELRISLSSLSKNDGGGGGSTWLWVTGGTLLVAGAVVGGYFLFKPEDKPAP